MGDPEGSLTATSELPRNPILVNSNPPTVCLPSTPADPIPTSLPNGPPRDSTEKDSCKEGTVCLRRKYAERMNMLQSMLRERAATTPPTPCSKRFPYLLKLLDQVNHVISECADSDRCPQTHPSTLSDFDALEQRLEKLFMALNHSPGASICSYPPAATEMISSVTSATTRDFKGNTPTSFGIMGCSTRPPLPPRLCESPASLSRSMLESVGYTTTPSQQVRQLSIPFVGTSNNNSNNNNNNNQNTLSPHNILEAVAGVSKPRPSSQRVFLTAEMLSKSQKACEFQLSQCQQALKHEGSTSFVYRFCESLYNQSMQTWKEQMQIWLEQNPPSCKLTPTTRTTTATTTTTTTTTTTAGPILPVITVIPKTAKTTAKTSGTCGQPKPVIERAVPLPPDAYPLDKIKSQLLEKSVDSLRTKSTPDISNKDVEGCCSPIESDSEKVLESKSLKTKKSRTGLRSTSVSQSKALGVTTRPKKRKRRRHCW